MIKSLIIIVLSSLFIIKYDIIVTIKQRSCKVWYHYDSGPKTDLISCPPTVDLLEKDTRFESDPACKSSPCFFHPNAEFCVRSRESSPTGGGQQCCYVHNKLLVGPPGGGTADNHHYKKQLRHGMVDVIPWLLCCYCESNELCALYYEKRPSDNGTHYELPLPSVEDVQ